MRIFGRLLLLLVLLIAVGAAVGGFLFLVPYGPSTEQFVDIAPGTSTAEMAAQLRQAGIIRSAAAFEALKAVRGGSLKAGEYRFDHPAPLTEIYDRLRRGDVYTVTVVIPEGYNIFDIADAIGRAGLKPREEVLAAERQHTELIRAWDPQAQTLEGFLFPDTYKFSRHATTVDLLATMVKRFAQVAARLDLQPENAARVVTMASLVEREVHIDAERATVAGVFENRLAAGMPLQTDPAVQYASQLAGTWTGVIHQSELHSASPYNTYVHPGLPPGPICNPGIAALKAALHPTHTDFLYFVADAHGQTRFSQTLEEHNRNVGAYRSAIGDSAPPDLPPPPPLPAARPVAKAPARPGAAARSVLPRGPKHHPKAG